VESKSQTVQSREERAGSRRQAAEWRQQVTASRQQTEDSRQHISTMVSRVQFRLQEVLLSPQTFDPGKALCHQILVVPLARLRCVEQMHSCVKRMPARRDKGRGGGGVNVACNVRRLSANTSTTNYQNLKRTTKQPDMKESQLSAFSPDFSSADATRCPEPEQGQLEAIRQRHCITGGVLS
jgi:hypothetical protein